MRIHQLFLSIATLGLALVCSTNVQAQAAAPDVHQARVEQRIRDMYATLHITQAQEAEWNAFAQVMLDNAQKMDMTLKQYGTDRRKLSAPQILSNYAAISAAHAQNVERLSSALGVLYANLSLEQQRIADSIFSQRAARDSDERRP